MRKYLVVDDNEAFAENLAEILTETGAEVDVAHVGADVLSCVRRAPYDALVSDMKMPLMGGAALLHELRKVDPALPAIMVTAYTNDAELAAARDEGVLAVLPKPVPLERLVALLRAARRAGPVLLVDDDPRRTDELTEELRGVGLSAVVATTLAELDALAVEQPVAALVGLRSPGEADTALRRLVARYPKVPVVATTGDRAASDAARQPLPVPALLALLEQHARR